MLKGIALALLLFTAADKPKLELQGRSDVNAAVAKLALAQLQLERADRAYRDAQALVSARQSEFRSVMSKYEVKGWKLNPDTLEYEEVKTK